MEIKNLKQANDAIRSLVLLVNDKYTDGTINLGEYMLLIDKITPFSRNLNSYLREEDK